ncbi:FAD Malate-dehydrogenase (MDH-FAD) [Cardiosporidium cionae]|uniref:L-2-hydroxyglutarate dehydrogenase, mitochondrial n=1 Tax=Cardiosporidium cionae TaxID=476202 RepID=A0ABQ7JFD6_9APIC|nr:FAD Malate-dehydrogenase (MDH-FAD) [Cardiosporidium cionae]|eukprot:KAF8822585.1 FAD Malate-dehydrogenase (MDH-FAD) [Cardiosporidium cionae]
MNSKWPLCFFNIAIKSARDDLFSGRRLLLSKAIATKSSTDKIDLEVAVEHKHLQSPSKLRSSEKIYDVFIVGGGVTGTALLYTLSAFTDLSRVALCERRHEFAKVASAANNNSQTIHCGDIETNYSLLKAKVVKRHADMLRNYATKLIPSGSEKTILRFQKMALGVGEQECALIENRFNEFKSLFPRMKLLNKTQIAEVEPRVAMLNSYTLRPACINAIYIENEYSAVDYHELSKTFVRQAEAVQNKQVDTFLNTEVISIHQESETLFTIKTKNEIFKSRFVVVSACGHSLLMAHRMGYGLQYSCLPVAGSFYFTPPILNGKVYTVQDPKLPFAAVHGDPDVIANGKTRFGPTALPLPLLERYNLATVKDFLEVLRLDMSLLSVYWDLFKVSHIRNYILRNFLFEVPQLSTAIFLKVLQFLKQNMLCTSDTAILFARLFYDARKIIPSLKLEDLTYAKGFGGVRPQLIDKTQKKLLLGEGKINPGTGIIFNITPSPGGTTCLGTAETDMKIICDRLGANIDHSLFRKTILMGEYSTEL